MRRIRYAGPLLVLLLAACGDGPEDAGPESATPADPESASAASEPAPEPAGAEEAFLAWLEASRAPDADAACAAMSDALVDRMIAEMAAEGWPGIDSCEAMIEATAELHAAFGSSAEVTIEVQEETATDAFLFVTYVDSGECGTVAMTAESGRWILTDQSEECA